MRITQMSDATTLSQTDVARIRPMSILPTTGLTSSRRRRHAATWSPAAERSGALQAINSTIEKE